MTFLMLSAFSIHKDAAAQLDTSDSALSDCQPPPKRKYVFKNKNPAPIFIYSRGT